MYKEAHCGESVISVGRRGSETIDGSEAMHRSGNASSGGCPKGDVVG
jgi:hypothetical protein